ncbi:hypothetical protein [Streptomyces asoensis]|nr:hypothetical protein [Streptomyces asoensis]
MPNLSVYAWLVAACWTVGALCLLAAGLTALTTAIRHHRRNGR